MAGVPDEGDGGRTAHIVAMTIIVFALLAAAFIVLVFLVSACLHEEHRYPHPDPEAWKGPELSRLDRFGGGGHRVAPQVKQSVDQDDLRTLGATILRARVAGDAETLQVLINTSRPMDLFNGLMITAETLAHFVAAQRECSALEVAESLHYVAVDMLLGQVDLGPDENND